MIALILHSCFAIKIISEQVKWKWWTVGFGDDELMSRRCAWKDEKRYIDRKFIYRNLVCQRKNWVCKEGSGDDRFFMIFLTPTKNTSNNLFIYLNNL